VTQRIGDDAGLPQHAAHAETRPAGTSGTRDPHRSRAAAIAHPRVLQRRTARVCGVGSRSNYASERDESGEAVRSL
jgi:hypothetical protein